MSNDLMTVRELISLREQEYLKQWHESFPNGRFMLQRRRVPYSKEGRTVWADQRIIAYELRPRNNGKFAAAEFFITHTISEDDVLRETLWEGQTHVQPYIVKYAKNIVAARKYGSVNSFGKVTYYNSFDKAVAGAKRLGFAEELVEAFKAEWETYCANKQD